ncbi:MAG: PQQ-binding-like beta-propeller repeat protein [Candidatus Bathyarchaeia archaeon]
MKAQQSTVDWWPMFHHDLTHTGYSTSTGPLTNQTLWTFAADYSVSSSPAVLGNVVYIGSDNGNLYALDAATGKYLWSYNTNGQAVVSSPAVANGEVYFSADDDNLYALNAATGTKIWTYKIGDSTFSSPAVVNGLVYVTMEMVMFTLLTLVKEQKYGIAQLAILRILLLQSPMV